jgi:FkbM family methyltransferase
VPTLRFRDILKTLVRSRSLGFTIDMVRQTPSKSPAHLRWRGRDICYRPGTTDPLVLHQVLFKTGKKAEYYLPPRLKPEVILDIGSNVGASILYFHSLFPAAAILGFEPHPETFRILRSNVGDIPSVSVFNYGLGAINGQISARAETVNFGAFSTTSASENRPQNLATIECQVRRIDDVLQELGISKVDLIKIDCEGAEADIFAAMPEELLHRCQWIVGELHDHTGFDLLARLAPHFYFDLKKKLFSPLFRFHACNIDKLAELRETFDADALQR